MKTIETISEAKECASLMSACEPWITLGRTYDQCLNLFLDRSKDISILKKDDSVIAFCVILINSFPQPYIRSLAVHPEHREHGTGTQILKWAEEKYGHINGKMYLAVSSFNSRAIELYVKLGYVKIGELRDYIVEGYSEFLMEKKLKTIVEQPVGEVFVTDDKNKMDVDFIFNNLKELYWATNLTMENLLGRMMNSLCFGVFVNGRQVGFARVITDYFSFAYLADVFVEEKERGKGFSKLMMEYILDYPPLKDIKWLLATRDTHELYKKFGFTDVANPERFMGKNGWKSF